MGKRGADPGSTLRARSLEEKALTARLIEREVLPLFDDRARCACPIAATYPLEQAAAAYDHFAAGASSARSCSSDSQ